MDLKDIGEFGLIDKITQNVLFKSDEVVIGIGDDTAVLPLDEENYLLAACDMLIEDVHFLRNKSTPFQIGYKAVAVNFSDIAAMGGWPTGILISLGVPPDTPFREIEQLYSGIKAICQKYGVNIIGGDTVSSPGKWIINISVLGRVKKNFLHLRSQAKVGDLVFVTGDLGDAAAGLEIILHENDLIPQEIKNILLKKHLAPEPCLEEIKILNQLTGLHALNDISDGLASEAKEIAKASRVGIKLKASKIPLSEEARKLGELLNKDPLNWALFGGEDFQIIGTIAHKEKDNFQRLFQKHFNKPLYFIGTVIEASGVFLASENQLVKLEAKGYNHFK